MCFIKKTKLLRNGEAPIFIRITIGLERGEFGLKKSILPKHWDEKQQRAKSICPNCSKINTLLSNQEQHIKSIADFLAFAQDKINPQAIITKIQGKKEKRRTILQIFNEHNIRVKGLMDIYCV